MKKLMFILFTLISISSCNNDDDTVTIEPEFELNGNWTLVKSSCGTCLDELFEPSEVIFTFDITNNEASLTVINNSTSTFAPESNTHNITFTPAEQYFVGLETYITDFNFKIMEFSPDFSVTFESVESFPWVYRFDDDKLLIEDYFSGENITHELIRQQ